MRIDLHVHSTFSDGMLTPTDLIETAVRKEIAAISLTDHDSLGGVSEALEAGRAKGVEVLSGVELSCEYRGRDLHVLGYGADPQHVGFQDMLTQFRETRHKRGLKIIEKLNALGIAIEPAEVLARAGGGALGRPHIAAVLVDRGVVSKVGEAFDKYIAEGGPAYVPKYKMSAADAIRYIHEAGGLAFTAHPGIFMENMQEMLDLVAEGFDGIEVFHPNHSASRTRDLEALAKEKGLLISGGSDFHGFPGRDNMGVGDVPYALYEKIKAALDGRA